MKSSRNATALFIVNILSNLSSISAQCNETDALLKVSYSISNMDESSGQAKRLSIRPSGNIGNSSLSEILDYSLEDLVNFERCVPREGACLEVTVNNFPLEAYEISWDGQIVVDKTDSKLFVGEDGDDITSIEVGDYCTPTCDTTTDEALFEYEYWTNIGFEDYRVEDEEGGNVILGCDHWGDKCQENNYDSLHIHRACLKRDACYRFLIGDNFERNSSEHMTYNSIRWDDEIVDKSHDKLFDSIKFGNTCEPDCNNPEESLVEFFMHRVTSSSDCSYDPDPDSSSSGPEPDFNWELRLQDPENKMWSVASRGVIPCFSNTTSLYHEAICVPKDQCASFSITSLEAHELASPLYTLTKDGVTYKHENINIDNTSSLFGGLNQTTLFDCSSVERDGEGSNDSGNDDKEIDGADSEGTISDSKNAGSVRMHSAIGSIFTVVGILLLWG